MRSEALVLLALAAAPAARAELVDRIVAIVEREVILLSEAEQARAITRARTGEDAPLSEIVDRLVELRLVEREVERFSGEAVPSALLDGAVDEIRARFATEEEFKGTLEAAGVTLEGLRSELRRQLATERYLERRFRALSFVTDEEVDAYYRDELPKRIGTGELPERSEVSELIRRLLEERKFNQRVEEWIEGLVGRAHVRRYVW
jgi:peptidyl-prolyl cis-trans isomerase SurA